jgi:hypothetical protein
MLTSNERMDNGNMKMWNKAPDKISKAKTLKTAKKAIRSHCKSLPIKD